MTTTLLISFLGWSTLINMGILTLWFVAFLLAHNTLYQLHSRWFKLSMERFDSIHYAGMAFCIFLLNLVPFLALQIAK